MVLPQDLLEAQLNTTWILSLKDGRTLQGKLVGFDQYMNVVLEDTKENGKDQERSLGTIILRGNNVVSMIQA
jgi:small nuclear ribonucleoprotein